MIDSVPPIDNVKALRLLILLSIFVCEDSVPEYQNRTPVIFHVKRTAGERFEKYTRLRMAPMHGHTTLVHPAA